MEKLIAEIKTLIVETLNLEDITPADINTDDPLFNEGLGLDSVDALELGVALQEKYGFKIKTTAEDLQEHFLSVKTLVDFVLFHQPSASKV